MQQQPGLKLEAAKAMTEVFVIDRVEEAPRQLTRSSREPIRVGR